MRRREFVGLVGGAAAWPMAARAQPSGKVPRVGVLASDTPAISGNLVEAFRKRLRDLGYVEGQNVIVEYRWADGKSDRLPSLAAELLRLNVDVIVAAGGGLSVLAAKNL